MAWVIEKNKKLLVLGNKNAITYKEIFPLIKENKLWVGYTSLNQDILFAAPTNTDWDKLPQTAFKEIDGIKLLRSPSIWFTNLEHGRRHQPLTLMTKADVERFGMKAPFQKYDNYDAIEVPKTKWIPSDYKGVMGVPISFLDKYCPEQFEIVGMDDHRSTKWRGRGPDLNGNPVYRRIIIRHKTS